MSRCSLGWSANDALSALDEGDLAHVKSCDACSEVVAIRARAKAAWSHAIMRDDEEARLSSELRLAHAWPKPRVVRTRPVAIAAALAAAAALVLGLRAEPPPQVLASPGPIHLAAVLPPTPPAPRETKSIVATAPCTACRAKTPIVGGSELPTGERVEIPAGAHLTLGFAFEDGLVDPKQGAEIEGPAALTFAEHELALDHGTAHLRDSDVVVVTPTTRVVTKHATYTLRVDERGAAHVQVESGAVSVDVPGASPVVVAPGKTFDVTPEPKPASAAAAAALPTPEAPKDDEPPAMSPDEVLKEARALFRGGDPEGARPKLEELSSSRDARIARRAQFTLAELELGAGKKDAARTRLEGLLIVPDPSLASDAATLLARSYPAPNDRAAVWARYLATSPASPYRERATLERAEALLDARRTAEAEALLAQVRAVPDLPVAQKRALDRLTFKAREVH